MTDTFTSDRSDPDSEPTDHPGEPTPTSFAELGVDERLIDVLAAAGIAAPFAIQSLTIADALAGRDVCGKAKTGSGKTLAFSIPLVQRIQRAEIGSPRGLVLVPTRELAIQVAAEVAPLAEAMGLRSVAVYGGAPMERQLKDLAKPTDILVATPGRLIDCIDRKAISVAALELVVLDEADRMADMGFLPQVEWILRHADHPHQTLLFSATLDGMVHTLIERYQRDPVHHEVATTNVTVDEMHHVFLAVHEMDRVKVVAAIVGGVERAIIFVETKRGADRLAASLEKEGVSVKAIHGDLRQRDRERALEQFTEGQLSALVATDVAARGIHVDDVDVVIHYEPSDDHKAYLHRSGRTARAGGSGVAVTLGLYNHELAVRRLQRRLGLSVPLVEVFSNDERLGDLVALAESAES